MSAATPSTPDGRTSRLRRYWDRWSAHYDLLFPLERPLVGDGRAWVCSQAAGRTVEVAVGTGRNLALYPEHVDLTAIDISSGMLAVARKRAAELNRTVELCEADARRLPFVEGSFDTVVSTMATCAVPDLRPMVDEMLRVLRPGGRVLLLHPVRPDLAPLLWLVRKLQWALDRADHSNSERLLRRPLEVVVAQGFEVERRERLRAGLIERLAARKPG